jgi:hypothetical protein
MKGEITVTDLQDVSKLAKAPIVGISNNSNTIWMFGFLGVFAILALVALSRVIKVMSEELRKRKAEATL